MIKRKRVPPKQRYPLSWTIHETFDYEGLLKLIPKRQFSVKGERGRFEFIHAVTTEKGDQWADCYDKFGKYRSIPFHRIKTVHSKDKPLPKRTI